MSQSNLTDFEGADSMRVPYPVPFPDETSAGVARSCHRKWYWSVHIYDEYQCPDCDRGVDDVWQFDVHHIDRNPRNGDPSNLVALCRRCHAWRHSEEPGISTLSVQEWGQEFANINESSFLR